MDKRISRVSPQATSWHAPPHAGLGGKSHKLRSRSLRQIVVFVGVVVTIVIAVAVDINIVLAIVVTPAVFVDAVVAIRFILKRNY